MSLALIQYVFDNGEHPVLYRPHGNSKKSEAFVRTLPSTLHKLKDVSSSLTPKFAVCKATGEVGGVMAATSAGSIPRNRQQVSDLRRRCDSNDGVSIGKAKDPLFSIMLMCKESEGDKSVDSFVRVVNGAPEPLAVLTFDWSLADLERFCTYDPPSILTVDPTFNLGDFFVTVTTYKHPMLINSSGKHPSMIGPLFIHQQKKFESYYFFASSLVSLNPKLRYIGAIGTDGEKALSDAFSVVFNNPLHVRCFLHFRGNLEAKLKELKISKQARVEYLRDVFGNPSGMEEGLVDSSDEQELEKSIENLKGMWNDREKPFNDPPCFYDWFVSNCKQVVQTTMLKPLRMAAGLGNPPDPYYTNDVESLNKVIKHQVKYKAQELPQFVLSMKEMIENQKKDIEKAIIGMGEYRLVESCRHLAIDKHKFFQMNEKQRDKCLKKFFKKSKESYASSSLFAEPTNKDSEENPFLCIRTLPTYVATKVWEDGRALLASNGICLSPGCSDECEWVVKSRKPSRKHPFFVQCKKTGQILCEQSCTTYCSSGICSHIVAVAYYKKSVDSFIEWMGKQKRSVNITRLSTVDMPKGRGKKPDSHRKASLKSNTKRIKEFVDSTDRSLFKSRVQPEDSFQKQSSSNPIQLPCIGGAKPGPTRAMARVRLTPSTSPRSQLTFSQNG